MTTVVTASPLQSAYYLDFLAHLATTDADRRRDGVTNIVERARQTRSLALRNRYWSDAVLILKGQWKRATDTVPFARSAVLQQSRLLEGIDAPASLRDLTVDVLRESWDSFASFQRSEEGRRSFLNDDDNWLGSFQEWFERYLPCLLLDLPPDVASADVELKRRIDWMLSRAFDPLGAPDGMRASFEDAAWSFARQNWAVSERADARAESDELDEHRAPDEEGAAW